MGNNIRNTFQYRAVQSCTTENHHLNYTHIAEFTCVGMLEQNPATLCKTSVRAAVLGCIPLCRCSYQCPGSVNDLILDLSACYVLTCTALTNNQGVETVSAELIVGPLGVNGCIDPDWLG